MLHRGWIGEAKDRNGDVDGGVYLVTPVLSCVIYRVRKSNRVYSMLVVYLVQYPIQVGNKSTTGNTYSSNFSSWLPA